MTEHENSTQRKDVKLSDKTESKIFHSGLPDTGILDPKDMPPTYEVKPPFIKTATGILAQVLDDILNQ